MNDDGVRSLCAAIVERAIKDYTLALRQLKRRPGSVSAEHTVHECERFFRRDMQMYADLDGEDIIRRIQQRVENDMRRERSGKRIKR